MSGAAQGQSPEPVGADRLQRARGFLDLKSKYGVSPETIAEREGLSRALVYRMIKEALAADAGVGPVPAATPEPDPTPAPRKLSENAMLGKIWRAMNMNGRLRLAPNGERMLWLHFVMAVWGESDDGETIRWGRSSGYYGPDDFAKCHGGTGDEFAELVRRGVLLELEGGVAVPEGFGLLPRERRGRVSFWGAVGKTSVFQRHRDPRQSEILHVVPGGRSHPGSESTERGISVDSESTKPAVFGHSESTPSPDSVDSPIFARASLIDDDDKENRNLPIIINQQGREHESTKTAVAVDSESTDRVAGVDSPDVELACEVLRLAGLDRLPSPQDVGSVQGWMISGGTAPIIREVVKATMLNAKGVPPSSLQYFTRPLRLALNKHRAALLSGASPAAIGAVPAAPAPVLSPADQAMRDRLRAIGHPFGPSLAACQGAGARAALAHRWLEVAEYWVREGRPSGLRPPDFTLVELSPATFETDLSDLEAVMTDPGYQPDG